MAKVAPASLTLDEFRCKLINKILFAESQEEVRRFIDAGMKGLWQHELNGHLIARFVDKVIQNLNEFTPMLLDAQQWSNIKMAQIRFDQLKLSMQEKEQR